jgi:hypothetical protein
MPALSPLLMPLGAEGRDGEFHRIGGAAVHRPAPVAIALEHLLRRQRRQERDRVPDTALLRRRRSHGDVSEPAHRPLHGREPRREDAVVIGQENLHGVAL